MKDEELGKALQETQPHIDIPPEVDEAILRKARAHRKSPRWVIGLVAAGIAFFVAVPFVLNDVQRAEREAPGGFAAADVSADTTIDVLDALVLSQAVTSGEAKPHWDQNGDSVVDSSDVDVLLDQIVDVDGGSYW